MIEKGISKYWTEEQERALQRLLSNCKSFAETQMVRTITTMLKYDLRSKEGKVAVAKTKLQLTIATDNDLRELANLTGANRDGAEGFPTYDDLVQIRAKFQEQGITKEELSSG